MVTNNLKKILKEKNIKQKELAKFLGVCQQRISQFCKPTYEPSLEQALKISIYLNIPVEYIWSVRSDCL